MFNIYRINFFSFAHQQLPLAYRQFQLLKIPFSESSRDDSTLLLQESELHVNPKRIQLQC